MDFGHIQIAILDLQHPKNSPLKLSQQYIVRAAVNERSFALKGLTVERPRGCQEIFLVLHQTPCQHIIAINPLPPFFPFHLSGYLTLISNMCRI